MGSEAKPPGDQKPEGEKKAPSIVPEQFVGALRELAVMVKTQGEQINKLLAKPTSEPPKQPKKAAPNEVDLMSNSQLIEHMLGKIQEEVVAPLRADLTKESTSREKKDIETQIKEVKGKYEHFDAYIPEIKKVIEEVPGLSLEDALAIAERRFPDKLQELSTKKAEAQKQEDEERKKKEAESFGGLLPTSGRTAKTDRMDVDQAAEAAWNEVVAELPDGITLN